jgi:hypothetical protein
MTRGIIVECEAVMPRNALVFGGICSGRLTDEDLQVVDEDKVKEIAKNNQRCSLAGTCRISLTLEQRRKLDCESGKTLS